MAFLVGQFCNIPGDAFEDPGLNCSFKLVIFTNSHFLLLIYNIKKYLDLFLFCTLKPDWYILPVKLRILIIICSYIFI